jgi:hypothetical protein
MGRAVRYVCRGGDSFITLRDAESRGDTLRLAVSKGIVPVEEMMA